MVTKTSKTATVKKPAAKSVAAASSPGPLDTDIADSRAKTVLRPSVNAAAVIAEYGTVIGEQDIAALASCLSDGIIDLRSGNMKRAEAMLYAQAHALQAIFMNFSRRALKQEYQKNLESFLRMGLKAQNQCRMTLEALATIKIPPVVFARQVNVAQQQVNNGTGPTTTSTRTGTHAANPATEQTELLEASDGQRLDTGAAGTASGADPHLETVGQVHRPAHR